VEQVWLDLETSVAEGRRTPERSRSECGAAPGVGADVGVGGEELVDDALAPLGLAYLHQMEAPEVRDLTLRLRKAWPTAFILNPFTGMNPTGPEELQLIEDGTADLIAYGGLFLANPDLPTRLQQGGPFNTPDRATSFGGDHRGFTDYPTLG
jgi:N-ethylmaleimide reductase